MSKITDPTLAAIASGYSTGGLTKSTAKSLYHTARLLLASRSHDDVSVFATARSESGGRFVVPSSGNGRSVSRCRRVTALTIFAWRKQEIMARKSEPLFAPEKPGEVLRCYIVEGNDRITQDDLANAMGVSRLTVNQLIRGKRSVTAEMALRLARVLSTTPDFWLNLQRDVDLFEADQQLRPKLKKLPVLRKSGRVAAP